MFINISYKMTINIQLDDEMRYTAEHKEQSRRRIVESARRLFRSRGFDAVSIDEIMNRADLTRGAFYAHFDSKDDLVRETLAIEAGLVSDLQSAEPGSTAAVLQTLGSYLDPSQRKSNATGCPLVSHPVDAIRGDMTRKQGYASRFDALVTSIETAMEGDEAHDQAVLVSVLTIGGALLSAAVLDDATADSIERVCLDQIRATMSPVATPSPSPS